MYLPIGGDITLEVERVPHIGAQLLHDMGVLPNACASIPIPSPYTPSRRISSLGSIIGLILPLQRPFPSLAVRPFVHRKRKSLDMSCRGKVERKAQLEGHSLVDGCQVPIDLEIV